ncbi:50S ribosomal protein L36e [Sphaeroforma arctica JP610]|uniref:60S ribosomal protein L36 n=1 Tax=Sphaeroforma arctica JP610 TaxID=667725 RepID=A0A0L0GDH7_9EUKA|nr:50S ribosomal protein L36e [Sphaeroforma arctica JP610]KNC86964.1 50S ribosomal protein L36e [Sphaeroforma arctica JP610]|eukprot:XP_014160866.1 50S ribosomal protein L36e [Sphaeroforma arctica JP610]
MAPVAISIGLKDTPYTTKGYPVTKRETRNKRVSKKGVSSARSKFVRSVVREMVGFAPYERRIMELLRVSKDKRALKLAKKRLGTHVRGKAKREEMVDALSAIHRAQTHK